MLSKKTLKTNLLAIIVIITLLATLANATKGAYFTEPFSCEVALADLEDLQKHLEIEPRSSWKYEIFLSEYEAVSNALINYDCEVK